MRTSPSRHFITIHCAIVWLAFVASFAGGRAVSAAPFVFHDDFSKGRTGAALDAVWDIDGFTWVATDGALQASEPGRSFAIVKSAPFGKRVHVEATLTPQNAVGKDWKTAGVVVCQNKDNYWHLALVAGPDSSGARHYIELIQCLKGQWLSNVQGDTALPTTVAKDNAAWEMGKPYRLTLDLTPEGITGKVEDAAGKVIGERGYRFPADKPAVTFGQPGLDDGGFHVAFHAVKANVDDVVPAPAKPAAVPPPPYDRKPMSSEKSRATGFFHVEKVGGTWWVIDPRGYRYYVVGTDHVNYNAHWCQKLGYAPYHRNCERIYGGIAKWAESSLGRLKQWGFNTLTAGHSPELRHHGMAHTEFISFGSTFSSYSDITEKTTWTGFPNVFDPQWPAFCNRRAKQFCLAQKDDPWLFGYFLDNELEWFGKDHRPTGLVDDVMQKPADHSAKQALVAFLRQRYDGVGAFNKAWGTSFASWEAFAARTTPTAGSGAAAEKDRTDFVRLIADRYFAATTAAIHKWDPNHMIIGCRFAGRAPDVWDVAGKYLDIVSVNYYGRVDLQTEVAPETREALVEYYGKCRRPMMLTEWSHPALDSGLPCTHGAGERFDTQAQRSLAFEVYQKMLFGLPFMVGSDFFMWADEPKEGISDTFPENTNYGMVDVNDRPYPELTSRMKEINPEAVAMHAGYVPCISVELRDDGRLALIRNSGRVPAKLDVRVGVDNQWHTESIHVGADATAKMATLRAAASGGHLVTVIADPERHLVMADRSHLTAHALVWSGRRPSKPVMLIGNPTATPLPAVVVPAPANTKSPVSHDSRSVHVAAYRLVPGTAGAGVTVSPFSAVTRPVATTSKVSTEITTANFDIDNGRLRLRKFKPDGDLIDEVSIGGVELGSFQAMAHQFVGQNLWVAANRFIEAEITNTATETRLDITVEYVPDEQSHPITAVNDETGARARQEAAAQPFRMTVRIELQNGEPCFQARVLRIVNTGKRPWHLVSWFLYMPSKIGGDRAGDHTSAPIRDGEAVPNYYQSSTAWIDSGVGAAYGVVTPDGVRASLWTDKGGQEHPDIYQELDIDFKPGASVAREFPAVTIYGAKTHPGDEHPERATQTVLQALAQVETKEIR